MGVGIVLDPTVGGAARTRSDDRPSGSHGLGTLSGRVLGIRGDELWRSWDWVVDEWRPALEAEGARVVFWRSAGNRAGKEAQRVDRELQAFLDEVDVVVSGLANCGSCTMWTVHDALAGADRGKPSLAVGTEQFRGLAEALAARGGHRDLPIQILPYPLETRDEHDVRAIARAAYEDLLGTLGIAR
jgi:hypothetical protein